MYIPIGEDNTHRQNENYAKATWVVEIISQLQFICMVSGVPRNYQIIKFYQISNLLKKSLRKTSLFVLFELLPKVLFKYVWHFVTTQHEWLIILCFYCKSMNEKVGEVCIS